MKIWTAIQHSLGLVAGLGLFILISAYSTDPNSGAVSIGLVMIIVGGIGFFGARFAARKYQQI